VSEVRITEIIVYPIKSTAGMGVDEWPVEPQGLAMDRRWMVVDEDGGFLSGREFPVLTQIRSRVEHNGLRVTAPGMDEMHIPVPTASSGSTTVRVWSDQCRASSAGAEVDDWFTRLLASRCRLVYMTDVGQRPVDFDFGRPGDRVSFADGYPLLLISEASLADLNSRLEQPVSMGRFRPNLVVSGCGPYEEDSWRSLQIGKTPFEGVKKCPRCVFTTIDPDNGEKHPRLEPLRTLSGYRRGPDGGVFFGQNLIPRSQGVVRVGDVLSNIEENHP
jgi:hypothetical protein